MNIDCTIQIWKEGGRYIAHAMPVDVMSCGGTAAEARAAVDEAVCLFVRTAAELGTLEDILREAGYECVDGRWTSPDWVAIEKHSLNVAV